MQYLNLDEPTLINTEHLITLTQYGNEIFIIDDVTNDALDCQFRKIKKSNRVALSIEDYVKQDLITIAEEKKAEKEALKYQNDLQEGKRVALKNSGIEEKAIARGFNLLNRTAMYNYAQRWANGRNPQYYDFENEGGDCTNFVSQVIRAGGAPFNTNGTSIDGWFYYAKQAGQMSSSWVNVNSFYSFVKDNTGKGPQGIWISTNPEFACSAGDIIQLKNPHNFLYYHSLVIVKHTTGTTSATTVAAHTANAWNKPLSSYPAVKRWISLDGYGT